jgi:hypothetical protein
MNVQNHSTMAAQNLALVEYKLLYDAVGSALFPGTWTHDLVLQRLIVHRIARGNDRLVAKTCDQNKVNAETKDLTCNIKALREQYRLFLMSIQSQGQI